MHIHGLKITFKDELDDTCSSAIQFVAAFISEKKEEYDEMMADAPVEMIPGQLVIPKIYLTDTLNKHLESIGLGAEPGEDQLTIVHFLAMVMLEHLNAENANRWITRLDVLLQNGADINGLSGQGDSPLKYIEKCGGLFARDQDQINRIAAIFRERNALLEVPRVGLK